MALFESFTANLEQQEWRYAKVILAVSGGSDSMCMAQLFANAKHYFTKSPYGLAGFDFVIAHCNFQLRGADSEQDAALVKEWATVNEVPYYQNTFDTAGIVAAEGNVQLVARRLRYEWFEALRKELNFDYIATAHHQQDSVETLLMNFFKGTGIEGLHGILPEKGRIIRPLLTFNKTALAAYANQENISWREDVSNQKTDYLRNKVRLELLPAIESIFPNAVNAIYQNSLRFGEIEQLYKQSIQGYRKKLVEQRGKDLYIPLRKLVHCQPLATIVYELLKPFGLGPNQLHDALQLIDSDSGRYINFEQYRLLKDRNFFIITPIEAGYSENILIEDQSAHIEREQFTLKSKWVDEMPKPAQIAASEAYIDAKSLSFPLLLRPWRMGDYLYPIGMGMKKKKVKKLLIDLKIPQHEKEQVWVVESNKKIVWVCGIRSDERFKVGPATKDILHLHFQKNNP